MSYEHSYFNLQISSNHTYRTKTNPRIGVHESRREPAQAILTGYAATDPTPSLELAHGEYCLKHTVRIALCTCAPSETDRDAECEWSNPPCPRCAARYKRQQQSDAFRGDRKRQPLCCWNAPRTRGYSRVATGATPESLYPM